MTEPTYLEIEFHCARNAWAHRPLYRVFQGIGGLLPYRQVFPESSYPYTLAVIVTDRANEAELAARVRHIAAMIGNPIDCEQRRPGAFVDRVANGLLENLL